MRTVCSKEVRERLLCKYTSWQQDVPCEGWRRIFFGRDGRIGKMWSMFGTSTQVLRDCENVALSEYVQVGVKQPRPF